MSVADQDMFDSHTAQRALESFVVENPDLEKLEALLEQFNIFEALGVIRQELRHSDFLAFLLDPHQNHGLGDAFVQRLLQRILASARDMAPLLSPVHLDAWDLGHLLVLREWHNIDILLVDRVNHLIVIIENKVDSTEHSDQLGRYLRLVRKEYPARDWKHLAVYLTPNGESPSESQYLPVDYGIVADAVEAVAENRQQALDLAVHSLMVHYARMLRRHIVTDSEIADLCRSIYYRHQRALDLIFEHRPDRQAEVQVLLNELIKSRSDLILDTESKQYIRFAPMAWEGLPRGAGWSRSGRIILFEFINTSDRLDLLLYVGPGPAQVRRQLIELAIEHQPPFKVRGRSENRKWKSIFSRRLLRVEDYENATFSEIEIRIRELWAHFLNENLPALVAPIEDAVSSIKFLCEEE